MQAWKIITQIYLKSIQKYIYLGRDSISGSKSKNCGRVFFFTLPIFDDAPTFAAFFWLWAAISPVRKLARPKSTTFSESSGQELSQVLFVKNFASRKYRGEGVLEKNAVFCNFPLPPQKNFQMAVNRTILILEPLPMAHLKAYVPNFPKHMRERSQSLKLWMLDLSEVRWSENLAAQNAVFSAFFERKCSLTAKPSIFDPIVLYIFRKLSIWGFRKSGWNSIFDILWVVRFLGTLPDRLDYMISEAVL